MIRLLYSVRCTRSVGQVTILGGLGILLSSCGGPSRISSNPLATRVSIQPGNVALSVGQTQQLIASVTYSDGTTTDESSKVRWTSSDASVGSINSAGMLRARSVGAVSISASLGGAIASTGVKVSSAAPQSIAISPSPVALTVGQSAQLTVTQTLTDGTTQDVTHTVAWSISNPSVIKIDASGLTSALKAGASNFTASLPGSGLTPLTASCTATIAPLLLTALQVSARNVSMPLGTSQQLTATGTYNDGSVRDLTAAVSWSSNAASILGVSATGEASALARGSATASASANGIGALMAVNVSDPVLTSVTIEPSAPSILVTEGIQLTAIGTWSNNSTSDLTSSVAWKVDGPQILELDSAGHAVPLAAGTTSISASLNGVVEKSDVVIRPVALVSYFSGASGKADTTVRITGTADPQICSMLYVFNQDQQMTECCGCQVSHEGMRTLSLQHDLLSNPLTGSAPVTGTVVLATSQGNGSCDPTAITPVASGNAWATHFQSSATSSATETPFTRTELGGDLLTNLQAQCNYIEMLGSGQGICTCGIEK